MRRLVRLPLEPRQHEELRRLLAAAGIEHRESPPRFVFLGGAILVEDADYPRARALLEQHVSDYAERARAEWRDEWAREHRGSYARWLLARLRAATPERLATGLLLAVLAALLLFYPLTLLAQQDDPPNGVLLVAKRGLTDPNFGRSVVLATHSKDGHTLGVILNRPTRVEHKGAPLWYGGPVMNQVVIALYRDESRPAAPAFHVLKHVYLSMHPENVDAVIARKARPFRLYSGFSAWSPGQLQGELERDSWHVLPADESTVFRQNTETLWEELVTKAETPGT
jgi:putative transcriptional regulator